MASQRINELNTLTSLDDADLILSFDDSGSESKAITRADLRTDLEPTAGDGIDLTGHTLTVDLNDSAESVNATTLTASGGGTTINLSRGDTALEIYMRGSSGASTLTVTGQVPVVSNTVRVTDDSAVVWEFVVASIDTTATWQRDLTAVTGSVYRDGVAVTDFDSGAAGFDGNSFLAGPVSNRVAVVVSSAVASGLEFSGGKLQVKDSDLSITESQISDFGTYATAASVSNVDNTADADKPVSTATQTALDLKIGTVAEDTNPSLGGELDGDGYKIVNIGEPTSNGDAATKNYVDAATSGQGAFWTPVQLEADSNITLSGEQTIDGVLTSASRVLVNGQTDPIENGIYVTDASAWSRATDADDDAEFKSNKTVFVEEGTTHSGNVYAYTNGDDPVVDTDALNFTLKAQAAGIADASIGDAKIVDLSASKLTGSIADARVVESNVTQHEASLSITESQISDLQTYLTAVAEGDVTAHEAALTILSSQISGTLTASQVPSVEGLNATYTADTEPTGYYFLVVDNNGDIKRLDKNFMEV